MKEFKKILFGGDYNPEQWPEDIWLEDMRIFKQAHINSATINVFSWANLQPSENVYDFSVLDKIVEMLVKNDYQIVLATSTAALPAWLSHRYPEVNRTDFEGRQHKFGHRHNACPNSPVFQKYSQELAGKIAERYGHLDNLVCWHISNEYGGECYCDNCAKAFRVWLKNRYGSIEAVNKAWNMQFWSHTLYDWEEIVLPNALGDAIDYNRTAFAGISIDYRRFMSDSILNNFKAERDTIRVYNQDVPVTTNLMGAYKPLDYFKFAEEMDIISWDNYPSYNTPVSYTAMVHDLMRGLKAGQPFMLMEQTPSQQNWQPYNSLKKPGQMRNMSYQAIAHGADTIQFFQLRRSVGGCEKFHGAVIDHVGHEHTRVFREVASLGQELEVLSDKILGAKTIAKVGILFDWPNYWGLEYTSGPTQDLKYVEQIHHYYRELFRRQIDVDIVGLHQDFSKYELLIAPCLYMVTEEQVRKIEAFVKGGGKFLTTMMSGIVDESDNVHLGGYPGPLKDLLGIWVEEFDALPPQFEVGIRFKNGEKSNSTLLCDVIHLQGAEALAIYDTDEFYNSYPVITKNKFGNGQAYYVGSFLSEVAMAVLFDKILSQTSIATIELPQGLEWKKRVKGNKSYHFLLNHTNQPVRCHLDLTGYDLLSQQKVEQNIHLEAFGVMIVEE
ncbi:beta-galactosidase [Streptococcus suis]|uniref:beta-galactosidase n=1 Tax=Streptococcus suis TaxID=1307 RepID=UPI001921A0DE|nr:beta-galactosidase [Streptococcus suis]MBL1125059.1 beta-galactosidase [Streptococcus suis]